jgi:hypothetical protein
MPISDWIQIGGLLVAAVTFFVTVPRRLSAIEQEITQVHEMVAKLAVGEERMRGIEKRLELLENYTRHMRP